MTTSKPFDFIDYNKKNGVCSVTRFLGPDNKLWIILSEMPQNKAAMSITNAYELIASQVVHALGVAPESIRWFEHYPPDWYVNMPGTLDEVSLKWREIIHIKQKHLAYGVSWRRLGPENPAFEWIRDNTTLIFS